MKKKIVIEILINIRNVTIQNLINRQFEMLLKEQQEYKLRVIEERMEQYETSLLKKVNHLEERIRSFNQKFERIDELSERVNDLHSLFDKLKENFDTKLMLQDDKIAKANFNINKLKQEDIQQLYNLVKKGFHNSKDLSLDMQNMKTKDIRQSEVLFKQELKQSNILGERLQSPLLHQRMDSYQKSDRMRSITLEKDKGQELKVKFENEDLETNKPNSKCITKNETQKLIDKYQFTLQTKLQNENIQKLSNVKIEVQNTEQSKILTQQQQSLLERTISQDHIPRSKYLNSTNHIKEQLKNLRK
ncbi:unnamed protein product (macronuclear) [Paramecium tetraurelia]|uniref:Uncharacterized protein n=1 Tax=Paramecium tetraurelia TaxID=5888 RepID=A0DNA2_PARTE|nr:uncharacterized protein GSPATT00018724001 [Paramecium tetraurelia]CAK84519.1 unnamed protein product [Paramecium tetraurelia]|eukprot:XP_001451916.1 hypothetical protein (macronuclear) [Paramecium tetraurelia strain d4-2]